MLAIRREESTDKSFMLLYAVLLFLLFLFSPNLLAQELVLTTGINPPLVRSAEHEGFVESVVEEVFRRLNIKARVAREPSKLSLINANTGRDDGVALRIFGIEKTYKNLIRVPEVIMCSEFVAYSKEKYPAISAWSELERYNISYVNGWRIFENNINHRGPVIKSDSAEFLFSMLRDDKAELVLYEKWQGIVLAKSVGMSSVVENKLPIKPRNMYIYLHRKHSHLVGDVAMILRQMKSDGTYQRIFDNTLKRHASDNFSGGYKMQILSGCE